MHTVEVIQANVQKNTNIKPLDRLTNLPNRDSSCLFSSAGPSGYIFWIWLHNNGGAPKELRRRRAEKQSSTRVFFEGPFLRCPLKVFGCFKGKPY